MPPDDTDDLFDSTHAHASELRNVAHQFGAYFHQLLQEGFARDEAMELLRHYHSAWWHAALVDGYEPDPAVSAWPPPMLPPGPNSDES